jgi:hypothetical protein
MLESETSSKAESLSSRTQSIIFFFTGRTKVRVLKGNHGAYQGEGSQAGRAKVRVLKVCTGSGS